MFVILLVGRSYYFLISLILFLSVIDHKTNDQAFTLSNVHYTPTASLSRPGAKGSVWPSHCHPGWWPWVAHMPFDHSIVHVQLWRCKNSRHQTLQKRHNICPKRRGWSLEKSVRSKGTAEIDAFKGIKSIISDPECLAHRPGQVVDHKACA